LPGQSAHKWPMDCPGKCLIRMSKNQSRGRIILDYFRNDRISTAVAPFSPRFTVRTVPAIIGKCRPRTDYGDSQRPIEAAIRKLVGGKRCITLSVPGKEGWPRWTSRST
jgi:hypothetical protein